MIVDLLVAGGGIIGTMTAFTAKLDNPTWTVVLVERRSIAAGATGLSAGLSFPIARDTWQAGLVRDSEAGYDRLRRILPGLPVHDIDVLWVVSEANRPELASRMVGSLRPADPDQVRRTAADFVVKPGEQVVGTAARCFYTYPAGIAEMLASWLRQAPGAAVWEGIAVRQAVEKGDRWAVELTDGRTIEASRVVSALGPWAQLPAVRRKKVAALHLDHRPAAGAPCVVFWEDDAFVLPLAQRGYSLFSYRNTTWDVDPDAPFGLDPSDVDGALAVLGARSPRLAGCYAGGRAFCDAYTPSWVPVIESRPGYVQVTGCSGSGVRLAPGLAQAALRALAT